METDEGEPSERILIPSMTLPRRYVPALLNSEPLYKYLSGAYASPSAVLLLIIRSLLNAYPSRMLALVRVGTSLILRLYYGTLCFICSALIITTKVKPLFVRWQNLLDQPGGHPNHTHNKASRFFAH